MIRRATQADQPVIHSIVRAAHLNPLNVQWPNFVVAEEKGCIVGVGQIRPHFDGGRELASLVVIPECRRRGIGGQIVRTLLADQQEPVFLFCEHTLERYYTQHGFQRIERDLLSPSQKRLYRVGSVVTRIGSIFSGHDEHLIIMRWAGTAAENCR